jgi:hypothetical protein
MDRTTLLNHLAKAIHDVEEGERQIFKQKEIVLELERAGHYGSDARPRLALLEGDADDAPLGPAPHDDSDGGTLDGGDLAPAVGYSSRHSNSR